MSLRLSMIRAERFLKVGLAVGWMGGWGAVQYRMV